MTAKLSHWVELPWILCLTPSAFNDVSSEQSAILLCCLVCPVLWSGQFTELKLVSQGHARTGHVIASSHCALHLSFVVWLGLPCDFGAK